MPASVLIAVTLSVFLGFLVMFLRSGDSGNVEFPQVRWDINRGSGAYREMLDRLRMLADTEVNVVVTNNKETRSFADIVIGGGNHAPVVHAIVRLSDFSIVRFCSIGTPHNFVLNLASGIPSERDATDDNWFLGKRGYDALARVAKQSLTAVDLGESGLEESLRDLGILGTDRTAQARGMLRFIIAITEASRFRPIASHIANGMDNGSSVFVTAQQVGLMRD
ncbi:hypothetical protein STRTUCAR8_01019 [Streptomyces turgidiscabies Car8]|uniref:Ribosome inactivating protein n=2 Tax=Streptomyces TaxID=1883 RepID=L7F6I0_STRT8|nr:hypothetical protein STRTUCAR8_01019 [Streptomyces turgidiscabies Car8]GAQ71443.1 ribosome inactivating protein [Streptomyces turgidiscabies]